MDIFEAIRTEIIGMSQRIGVPHQQAQDMASCVEERVRREMGSNYVYVAKQNRLGNKAAAEKDLMAGETVDIVAERYGVSGRTVWRWKRRVMV